MAARTSELAFLIDQFVAALRTPAPMLAGNIFAGGRGTSFFRLFNFLDA